jgi:hypothetical protein
MAANSQAPEYKEGIDRGVHRPQQPVVPTTQVRAGVTGHNVRYVLAAALAAVIVGFVIVYFIYV